MTNQKNTISLFLLTFFILLGSCLSIGVDRGILQIEKYAYSSQSLTFLTSCLSFTGNGGGGSGSGSSKCELDMKTATDYSAYTKKWEFTKSITLNNSEDTNNNNNTDTDTSSTTTANNDLFWVYHLSGSVTIIPSNSNTTSSSDNIKISFELDSYEWNNMKIGLFPLYGSGIPSLTPISNISCIPSSSTPNPTTTTSSTTNTYTSTSSANGSIDEWTPIKQYCTLILPPSSTQSRSSQRSHSFAFQLVQMNDPILSMGHFYPTPPPPLTLSLSFYQIGSPSVIPSSIEQEVIPKVLHLNTGNGNGKNIEFRFKSENMNTSEEVDSVVVEGMPQYGSISENNGTFTYSSHISSSTSSVSTTSSQSTSSSGSNMDFVYFDFLMNHTTLLTRQKVVFISPTPTQSQQQQQQSSDQIVEKHLDIYLFNSTTQTTFEQQKDSVLKTILQNSSRNNYTLLPSQSPSQTQTQSQSLMQLVSLIVEVPNPIEPSDMECHNCPIHIEQNGHLVNVTYPLLLTSLSDLNIYPISHYSQKGFTIMIPTIPTIPTTTPTTPDTGTTTPGTTTNSAIDQSTNSILKLQFSIKQIPPTQQEPQDGNTEGKRNESLFIFGWILFALIIFTGGLIFIYYHYKYQHNSQNQGDCDDPQKKEMTEVSAAGAAGSSTTGMNFVVVSPRISPPPTESLPELPVLALPQSSLPQLPHSHSSAPQTPTQTPPTVPQSQSQPQKPVQPPVNQEWMHSGIYEYPPQSSYTVEPLHFSTLTTVTEEEHHVGGGLYEVEDGESSPSVIDYYSEESIMTGITGMTGIADTGNINGSAGGSVTGIADNVSGNGSGNGSASGFKRPPVPKPRMMNKRRIQ